MHSNLPTDKTYFVYIVVFIGFTSKNCRVNAFQARIVWQAELTIASDSPVSYSCDQDTTYKGNFQFNIIDLRTGAGITFCKTSITMFVKCFANLLM